MARKNWIAIVFFLAVAGIAGIGSHQLYNRQLIEQIDQAREELRHAPSAEQYLSLYEQWSQLSDEQKAETPWGTEPYGGPELQRQWKAFQSQRFIADLPALLSGQMAYPSPLADMLYGAGWQQQLTDWQKKQDGYTLAATVGAICLSAAALLSMCGLVKWLFGLAFAKSVPTEQDNLSEKTETDAPAAKQSDAPPTPQSPAVVAPLYQPAAQRQDKPTIQPPTQPPAAPLVSPTPLAAPSSSPAGDLKSRAFDTQTPSQDLFFGWALDAKPNESAAAPAMMTPEPVVKGLTDLSEEVSAIRQLAAAQQDQMRKLQDGYDWMLVRRFCMRIIRCIDNIEDRLAKLSGDNPELVRALNDVRDELLIALESSGVEPYCPDVNTPYKGLERYAEAVSQRVPTDQPALDGAIAQVVRAGYQYLINDDEVKIVRCAQVKLYSCAAGRARSEL